MYNLRIIHMQYQGSFNIQCACNHVLVYKISYTRRSFLQAASFDTEGILLFSTKISLTTLLLLSSDYPHALQATVVL